MIFKVENFNLKQLKIIAKAIERIGKEPMNLHLESDVTFIENGIDFSLICFRNISIYLGYLL